MEMVPETSGSFVSDGVTSNNGIEQRETTAFTINATAAFKGRVARNRTLVYDQRAVKILNSTPIRNGRITGERALIHR